MKCLFSHYTRDQTYYDMNLTYGLRHICRVRMENVNKILLLSLKQELTALNDIVCDLPVKDNVEEIRSWLFPSKPHNFVDEFVSSEEVTESESFKTFLELIIDRLYVGIRIILSYIEDKCDRKLKAGRFIHRPKLFTLGFTLQRLWQVVLVSLSENVDMNNTKEKTTTVKDSSGVVVCNKEIQTDIISLNKCDSCSSAMLCMKNLLQSFNKNDFKNSVGGRQLLLRPKIYDITQFGCMLQTTTAIEKGINLLYEKLFLKERDGELLDNENRHLKLEISEKCTKIALLEREVELLKEKCEKADLKISFLCNQNEELGRIRNKQDYQIKTLNEIVNNLNKSVKDYNARNYELVCQREVQYSLYKSVNENHLKLIKFSTLLQSKLSAIEVQQVFFKNGFRLLEEIVDNVNKKLHTVNNIMNTTGIKVCELRLGQCDISSLGSKLQEYKKTITERVQEKSNQDSAQTHNQNSFQVKGNPIEDLTRQMEENNAAIKKLENENDKLRNIITKMNTLRK